MAKCEIWEGCVFRNNRMPCDASLAAIYKRHYCSGDYTNCARYMIYKTAGKDFLPVNLYPNQQDRAREIVAKAQESAQTSHA